MATVLNSLLNHTREWHEIVSDSLEDQFTGINRLIEEGICRTCSTLAGLSPLRPHQQEKVEKILTLLADHARRLPLTRGEKSVHAYQNRITRLFHEADTLDIHLLAQRIENLRKEGYYVTCHNRAEIKELIDARAQIDSLQPVVHFCLSVDFLSTSFFPNPKKVRELSVKAEEFSSSTLKAYAIAKEQLQKLTQPPKPAPEPAPVQKRTWRQIAGVGREKAYLCASSFFKTLFTPIRFLLKFA